MVKKPKSPWRDGYKGWKSDNPTLLSVESGARAGSRAGLCDITPQANEHINLQGKSEREQEEQGTQASLKNEGRESRAQIAHSIEQISTKLVDISDNPFETKLVEVSYPALPALDSRIPPSLTKEKYLGVISTTPLSTLPSPGSRPFEPCSRLPELVRKTNPDVRTDEDPPVRQHGLTEEWDRQLLARQEKQRQRKAARGPQTKKEFLDRAANARARKRHNQAGWYLVPGEVQQRAEAYAAAAEEKDKLAAQMYHDSGNDPGWWRDRVVDPECLTEEECQIPVLCTCSARPNPHRWHDKELEKMIVRNGDPFATLKEHVRNRDQAHAAEPTRP